jgi:serine/threonine protein kinase
VRKSVKLKERYEWEENKNLLSKKGSIATYFSKDSVLQRDVCLKFYSIKDESERLNATKLAKEAMMAYHPNLCSYYDVLQLEQEDVDTSKDKNFVLISEFIDGGTISEFCSLYKDPKIFQKLLLNILSGLAYLHQNKSFHPELKPSNILVKKLFQNPTAKLTDYVFIPSATLPDSEDKNKEEISYMAPEVLRKERTIDFQKANIWSFGVILYELITDFNPFVKRGFDKNEVTAYILNKEPELYLVTNLKMRNIIAQCLKKNPAERFSDINALTKAIEYAFIENQEPNNEFALSAPTPNSPTESELSQQASNKAISDQETKKNVNTKQVTSEKSKQKSDNTPLHHPKSSPHYKSSKDYSWGTFAFTISTIFLGFLAVIGYSEYYKQKALSENRKIIVRHRQVYKNNEVIDPITDLKLPDDNPNVSIDNNQTAYTTQNQLQIPVYTYNSVSTSESSSLSQEQNTSTQNMVSMIPNIGLRVGEMKTLNLAGLYQSEDVILKAITKNIEIKPIGKQLYLLKPLSGGLVTMSVVDKKNGETIDSKNLVIAGRPEVQAAIGNDLSNTTASSITVLSKLGLKALSSNEIYDVSSFTLKTTVNGEAIEETTRGFLFNDRMRSIIKNAQPNQRITFDNIKAKSSTGDEILLKEVYVSISQN